MGTVRSRMMRAVRSQIQTESRMQKVIEKEKPTQAPRHPTTVESFERLINENPSLQNVGEQKDANFLNMLNDFKVDSTDPEVKRQLDTNRVLGRASKRKEIIPGKLTAVELLQLFERHAKEPEDWTHEKISSHYHLDKELVNNLLTFYSSFNVIQLKKPVGPLDDISL